MMIKIHIDGIIEPIAMTPGHAAIICAELERAGKKWHLGSTC